MTTELTSIVSAQQLSVVVTRAVGDANVWVSALAQAGYRSLNLPLMAFGPPPQPTALKTCLNEVRRCNVLMFVSAQAAHSFFAELYDNYSSPALSYNNFIAIFFDSSADVQLNTIRCWAPGPGTARALMQIGVPLRCIDQPLADATQFDSEALWAVVQPTVKQGDQILVVRGASPVSTGSYSGGRDWLAAQCQAQGALVQHCVAYSRAAPFWSEAEYSQAKRSNGPFDVWLLTSSESVAHLSVFLPGHDWSRAVALTTHPRIAQAAELLGFGKVLHSRPTPDDVIDALGDVVRVYAQKFQPPKIAASL